MVPARGVQVLAGITQQSGELVSFGGNALDLVSCKRNSFVELFRGAYLFNLSLNRGFNRISR